MKNFFKSFIHQPKKVITVSLIIAIVIGIFGYISIHKVPTNQFTKTQLEIMTNSNNNNVSTVKNLSLGFLSGGRIKTVLVKVGDRVKKDEVLATLDALNIDGALIQAQAVYETAKANYQKVINGATGTAVVIAKAAVNTAEVNLKEVTKQQEILVDNAYKTLLNSSIQAQSISDYDAYDVPTVSGTYTCNKEGFYNIKTYGSSGGISVNYSGLEEGTLLLTDVPRFLGNCGLFLSFDKTKELLPGLEFNIQIPNKSAINYNLNNNAYQLASQTKEQAVALAQATLDQANASLQSVVASARPEDIAQAQAQVDNALGALQIVRATKNNTTILAPSDGIITAVSITPGQIALPNTPAIEFLGL